MIFSSFNYLETYTFYGKLVLKTSPLSSRSLFAEKPFIFATRRSTYLKKDGDVFKIHNPGLAPSAGRDSISFESVRWPGYFLKHRVEENDFKFRIASPQGKDYKIFSEYEMFNSPQRQISDILTLIFDRFE